MFMKNYFCQVWNNVKLILPIFIRGYEKIFVLFILCTLIKSLIWSVKSQFFEEFNVKKNRRIKFNLWTIWHCTAWKSIFNAVIFAQWGSKYLSSRIWSSLQNSIFISLSPFRKSKALRSKVLFFVFFLTFCHLLFKNSPCYSTFVKTCSFFIL